MGIKIFTLTIVITLLFSCSLIQVNDDGSRYYSHSNIKEFNLKDLNTSFDYKSQEEITFQLANASNLKKAVRKNKFTWVFIWGDWCHPCIQKLPKIIEIAKNNPNLAIMLVADGYRTGVLQKILFEAKCIRKPYILDSKFYGTNVKNKVKKFNKDLCPESIFQPGFPQNYIFKEDGSLLLYQAGAISDSLLVVLGII